ALGAQAETGTMRLENIVFAKPLVVGQEPLEVHIALQLQDDATITFEIYSGSEEDPTVYSQGRAAPGPRVEPPALDLEQLKAQSTQTVDSQVCYEIFDRLGLTLGPAFRS